MNLSELYTIYRQHPVVTTDSRVCIPGSIFFALKGEFFDGNRYAEKALQAGCSYAIIDDTSSIREGENRIVVKNVLETLQQLAALHRKTLAVPVIGITGTNGKTTTKELLSAVLSQKYRILYTQGNLNNHIGVPLTLLRLTEAHEIAVIEMGANHPGEIRDLANIAQPDYGIITNVGRAHLEGFGSFEGVIKTKGELYEYLRRTSGKIFINRNDKHLTEIAGGIEQITYGATVIPSPETEDLPPAQYPGTTPKPKPSPTHPATPKTPPFIGGCITDRTPCLSLQWRLSGEAIHTIKTHLIGDYNLWNVLAAVTAGIYFGVPPERINTAIAAYKPDNHRSQLKKTAYNTLIIDAYNANPDSMKAALENFAALDVSPKAVILGDMRELGKNSRRLHEEIIRQIKDYDLETILLCGEQFSETGKEHTCFPNVEALAEHLKKKPLKGFHILIKGSRGLHLEKTIDKL
ncbi:MAG: UDP-N-acetylmuramoyl-tripeptide--D-alanyl-D-alanine ligase, partial [Tannerella sp.]|nr:UDP-N-acetylmuramoyl-tripeptide--D-alanyl-D-alanine ligase [Tannerella sp.]